jgi:hypothetical protein
VSLVVGSGIAMRTVIEIQCMRAVHSHNSAFDKKNPPDRLVLR